MRRRDELLVGFTILTAVALVVVGALWLSQSQLGGAGAVAVARFRTVGGMGVGDPVVLRGVRIGRVREIRLGADDWVEAELEVYQGIELPGRPGIVAASRSLFGEWAAEVISLDEVPEDPAIVRELDEAMAIGDDVWPGATLPDIGQLTAQANRIARDITTISSRVQTVFDSQAVTELQQAIRNFTGIARRIDRFTEEQTEMLGGVGENLRSGSDEVARAARQLQATVGRLDSATSEGELQTILDNTEATSTQLRAAVGDFRELIGVANANQASLVRMIQAADTVMTRLERGEGTLGLLLADSTLYWEATMTVVQLRQLLADVQENPRKYFKFSVF